MQQAALSPPARRFNACSERSRQLGTIVNAEWPLDSGMNAGNWPQEGTHTGEGGWSWVGHGCKTRTYQRFRCPQTPLPPLCLRFADRCMTREKHIRTGLRTNA